MKREPIDPRKVMEARKISSERAWNARADLEEAFSKIDPLTGHPLGRTILVHDDTDVLSDGAVEEDFSIEVKWYRCSVKDFIRIAEVLKKHFPEFAEPEQPKVEVSSIASLLTRGGICVSQSEARRLVAQGAVVLDGEVITDPCSSVSAGEHALRVGKLFDGRVTAEAKS